MVKFKLFSQKRNAKHNYLLYNVNKKELTMKQRNFGIMLLALIILLTSCKEGNLKADNIKNNLIINTKTKIDLQNDKELIGNIAENLDLIISDEYTFHIPYSRTTSHERNYDGTTYEINLSVSSMYYEGNDDEVLYGEGNELFAISFNYSIFDMDSFKYFIDNVKRISIEKMNLSNDIFDTLEIKNGISTSGYSYIYFNTGDYPEYKYYFVFLKFNDNKLFAFKYKHPNDNLDIETIINSISINEKKELWKESNEIVTENIKQAIETSENTMSCYRLKIKIPYLYDKGRFNQYVFMEEKHDFDFYIIKNKELKNKNSYNTDKIKNYKSTQGLNYQSYKEKYEDVTKNHIFVELNEFDTLYICYDLPELQFKLFDENVIIDSIQINTDINTWKAVEESIVQFTDTDESQFAEYIRIIIPEPFEKLESSNSIIYKNASNNDLIEFIVHKTDPNKSLYKNTNEILHFNIPNYNIYKGTTKEKYKYIRLSYLLNEDLYNSTFIQLYPGIVLEVRTNASEENIDSYLNLINKITHRISYS